jgi:spermidine/putrescine transport system permease protein
MVPSLGAIFVGMVYAHLPFLILPVYASVEKIDWGLVEAAQDLGTSPARAFWHVIVPQTMPGIIAGVMLVFIPALGNFITPDLLGGSRDILVGNVIQQQFGPALNWPFGSAISFVVLSFVLIVLYLYARAAGDRGMEVLG